MMVSNPGAAPVEIIVSGRSFMSIPKIFNEAGIIFHASQREKSVIVWKLQEPTIDLHLGWVDIYTTS